MKINNAIFLNYLLCPYKAGLLLGHQSATLTDYQVFAEDLDHRYEPLAREAISRSSPDVVLSPDRATVASILREGPSLILDVTVEIGDFEFPQAVAGRGCWSDILPRSSPSRLTLQPLD
jgi:hypothetical protein